MAGEVFNKPTTIIMADKGGVGKTGVAVNIAIRLAKFMKLGLLDADIDSPNLPEILGIKKDMNIDHKNFRFYPVPYKGTVDHPCDIKVFSMGCYHTKGGQGWANTGDVNRSIIQYALNDSAWGTVRGFVVDLPAGSSDELNAVLALFNNIVGAIVVTEPTTESDLRRCFDLCTYLAIPIIGVIENKHGAVTECGVAPICPKCKTEFRPLGDSTIEQVCVERGINYLGAVPFFNTLSKQIRDDNNPIFPKGHDAAITDALKLIKPLMGVK